MKDGGMNHFTRKMLRRAVPLAALALALPLSAPAHAAPVPGTIYRVGTVLVANGPSGKPNTAMVVDGNSILSSVPLADVDVSAGPTFCTHTVTPFGYLTTCPQPAWWFIGTNGGNDVVNVGPHLAVPVGVSTGDGLDTINFADPAGGFIDAGRGADKIHAQDGAEETINCGSYETSPGTNIYAPDGAQDEV